MNFWIFGERERERATWRQFNETLKWRGIILMSLQELVLKKHSSSWSRGVVTQRSKDVTRQLYLAIQTLVMLLLSLILLVSLFFFPARIHSALPVVNIRLTKGRTDEHLHIHRFTHPLTSTPPLDNLPTSPSPLQIFFLIIKFWKVYQCWSPSGTNKVIPSPGKCVATRGRIFCVISFMESALPECHTQVTEFRAFSIKNRSLGCEGAWLNR